MSESGNAWVTMPDVLTVTGTIDGLPATVRWRPPGVLDGDPYVISRINRLIAEGATVSIGGGPPTGRATLSPHDEPIDVIAATIYAGFHTITAVDGLAQRPAPPAGAQG